MCKVMEDMRNQAAAEAEARGREEGIKEGELNRAKKIVFNLHVLGMSNDDIATVVEVSVDTVNTWLAEPQAAHSTI